MNRRSHRFVRAVRSVLLLMAALVVVPRSASAQLRFCNDTAVTLSTAVATLPPGADDFVASGWYNFESGECGTVVDGPLTSPSYFVYAEKEDGTPFVSGDSPFCSPSGKFTLPGTANCDFSDIHLFKELDKENATSRVIHFECSDCLDPDLEETIQRLLPSLEDYANASAPSSYETPDWIDVGPADVQFNVARDRFHLQLTGSKLSVHVRARYQIEVSNLVLGSIRFNTASCGIGEEPRIADADVSIVLGVSDDGALLSHSRIDSLSFPNRCTLTAADIDVTDDIEDVVRKQLLEIGREFDAEVRKLDIR